MNKKKLIIIGKTPPPIGGVTIHVQRLLDSIDKKGLRYEFISTELKYIPKIFAKLTINKYCHLHTSNVFLRFFLILFSKIIFSKVIFTYHANLGTFNSFKNFLDKLSIKFSFIPIMINERSFREAILINKRSLIISAFIPPTENIPLSNELLEKIYFNKVKYKKMFCTNAYDLVFDKQRKEVYGITDLISLFNRNSDKLLIISDPSGNYFNYIIKNSLIINENIMFISEPHSFFEIIKLSDILIRHTTTDGDSLSVKEGLFLNKVVLATNVVDRPTGVISYSTINELKRLIEQSFFKIKHTDVKNGFDDLFHLYKNLIDSSDVTICN